MKLPDMIAGSRAAAVISNPRLPDNPIVDCNEAFVALTGYGRDEIVGRNCRFLTGPATEAMLTEQIRAAVREARPVIVDILNYRKDGTPFRNAVMVAPIFGADGTPDYFLGSQVAIVEPAIDRAEPARQAIARLSPRQRAVLIGVAAGKPNKQIAFELGITERTVKMHKAAMLAALGLKTSADAMRLALEAGF